MKTVVNISRWVTGLLFIFSGLVKANDPHGLAYKMEEFFERWSADGFLPWLMDWLHQFSLQFSILMIVLEIVAGVAILIGLWKNFFTWLLFILIIFFTILTGYADLSGKIKECGCFGDCIPLTSRESFIKDLVLLALITLLLAGRKYIKPLLPRAINVGIFAAAVIFAFGFQWYVMQHLPVVDCLPFKVGNNILELRKVPSDADPGEKEFIFIYEKEGEQREFTVSDLPDSTWTFVDRKEIVIKQSKNEEPPIKDFELLGFGNRDWTESVLNINRYYFIFYVKDINKTLPQWEDDFLKIYDFCQEEKADIVVVTTDPDAARHYFNEKKNYQALVLSLDAVAFKTVARTSPELYFMHGPVVMGKWGKADLLKAVRK